MTAKTSRAMAGLKKAGLLTGTVMLAGATSVSGALAQATAVTALTGATVIDGTGGSIENGVILIEDGLIACTGTQDDCPLPDNAETVELSGHFITPGLVDAHVHFAQTGWLDGRPDGIPLGDIYPYENTAAALRANPDRWHATYLCSGITAVYDVGGQAWTVTGEHASDTDRADRVHVRAAGPLTTHADALNQYFVLGGAADQALFLPMNSSEDIAGNVARLDEIGAQAMKVWYLAPPDGEQERLYELLMETGQAATEAGLPMIVHATTLREAKMALRAGATMLVHSVDDQPVDQEFLDLLIANNAFYTPTLQAGANWGRAIASVVLESPAPIDDPNKCIDADLRAMIEAPERLTPLLPDGLGPQWAYRRLESGGADILQMQQNLIAVHEAGGRIATATDAGNPMTLHGPSIYREMELMEAAGLSPETVIGLSTLSGAEAMGLADEIGTLEAGKTADLIVLSKDPREGVSAFRSLTHVMRKGVLSAQEELQRFQAD